MHRDIGRDEFERVIRVQILKRCQCHSKGLESILFLQGSLTSWVFYKHVVGLGRGESVSREMPGSYTKLE